MDAYENFAFKIQEIISFSDRSSNLSFSQGLIPEWSLLTCFFEITKVVAEKPTSQDIEVFMYLDGWMLSALSTEDVIRGSVTTSLTV